MVAHRHYRLYVHVTWHTWNRAPFVTAALKPAIIYSLRVAAQRTNVQVLRLGILTEHLHLLLALRPDSRLSEFVGQAKGLSARLANRSSGPSLKWCRGFFADSIGAKDLKRVARYIERQHQHHPDRVPQ